MKRRSTSPEAHTTAPERVLVLWCPDWPVVAATRIHGLPPKAPIALIESGAVFACSAAARAQGVRRGLRLREAQSRCPELLALPYKADEDARAFEPVLAAIEEAVSGVQSVRPGVCVIRARGPARYYGSEEEAALWLLDHVDELGIPNSRVGVADGVFTALHAARAAKPQRLRIVATGGSAEFLAPLPVAVLEDENLVTLLRRLGVYTLADFAALAPSSVLDRFGPGGARLHALAAGLDSRPVLPRSRSEELDTVIDFEPALDRIDQVAFGVRAAADRFVEGLVGAKLVCTALSVEVDSERGEHSERTWLHPRSFTASEVVDRVRWQLQGGSTETGLTSGVVRVRLLPDAVDSIGNHEAGLWGSGPDERVHHALSRLQSMLGHSAVVTAAVSGGRTLADRVTYTPWGERMLHSRPPERPWPGQLPPLAPTTVFEPPHPVTVFSASGTTVTVDGRGALSAPLATLTGTRGTLRVHAWAGPWMSDERWWDADSASRASRFQVVDSGGTAWLLALRGHDWWLEGRYD